MIQKTNLKGVVSGQGYDTRLQLYFIRNGESRLLSDYWVYRLFSVKGDELRLNLNFGTNRFLPHVVKQIDETLMLIPRFANSSSATHMEGLPVFDWRKYLELVAPHVFIFRKNAWDDLWTETGLSPEGLPGIRAVTGEEILTLWLITSGFRPKNPLTSFIPEYGKELADNILAEEPENHLSVEKILRGMLSQEVALESSLCLDWQNGQVVTAYIWNEGSSTREWPALLINNHTCVLLNGFPVKLSEYGKRQPN